MAVSQGISSLPPAPIVGQAFVTQYYNVLQQSPNMVYRFYQDCSKIARPGLDGEMETVTTMEGINSRIMSLDYSDFKPVIKSIDAQESHEGGVIVLVTGSLTFKGTGTRSFAQSFFLAPQEKGFFVLNDVFKYLDEEALPQKQSDVQSNGDDHPRQASITKTAVSESGSESKASSTEQVEIVSREEPVSEIKVPAIIKHEEDQPKKGSVEKDVVVEKAAPATKSGVPKPSQQPPQPSQETVPAQDAPKKSYASIVKVMMEKKDAPAPIIPIQRSITVKVVEKSLPNSAPQKQTVIDNGMNGSNGNLSSDSEGNGCSIYIRNLPLNATSPQVEEAFKKFGAIKPTGVQVRSKQGGFCFGFVEFEEQVSVQNALEASPIIIGGRQAYVEEKRPGSGPNRGSRGGPMPGRGGFRADGGRGARGGGYFGGRGNGRSDSGNKAEVNSRASQVAQDVDSDILEGFQVKNGRSRRNNRMVPNNVPRIGSVVA